jgi:hypothetical protein
MVHLRAVCLILALFIFAPPAAAQSGIPAQAPEALLLQGLEQYRLADFVKARDTFEQVLAAGEVSAAQLAQAHAYLGLIHLALDEPGRAQASFAKVKAADPSFQPDPKAFPPKALELFNRARAAEGATPAPPPPPAGYVVEAKGQEVIIDLGGSKGVSPGDRFRVVGLRRIKHPVTGQELAKREERGVIQVSMAQAELSTALITKGGKGIGPGDMIFRLPREAAEAETVEVTGPKDAAKGGPKQPETAKPGPVTKEKPLAAAGPDKPAKVKEEAGKKKKTPKAKEPAKRDKGLTVAVLPPLLRLTDLSVPLGPDDFPANEVGRALSRIKGVKAWGISEKKLKQVEGKTGFKPGDFLMIGGASLRSVAQAIREGDKEVLDFPGLTAKQTARLSRSLAWLGANAVLIWSVESSAGDNLVIWVNLYRKGEREPVVRDSINMFQDMAAENHAEAIADLVKGVLADLK